MLTEIFKPKEYSEIKNIYNPLFKKIDYKRFINHLGVDYRTYFLGPGKLMVDKNNLISEIHHLLYYNLNDDFYICNFIFNNLIDHFINELSKYFDIKFIFYTYGE